MFLYLFFFLNIFYLTNCWPSGAPEIVCESLMPNHGNNKAKDATLSPFYIEQSNNVYQTGDQIKVTITAPTGISFKGLIIQAYDPNNNQPIGSFQAGKGLKVLDSCSSITHVDRKNKKSATLIWDAPEATLQPKQVVFRTTIVRRFSEFFTNLDSNLETKKV